MAKLKLKYGVRTALGQISIGAGHHTAESIQLAWDADLRADGGMLFVCSHGATFALDAPSGAYRWFYPIFTGFTHKLIAAHGGRLYVEGDHPGMVALDGQTGRALWQYHGMTEPSRVLFDDAHLYAADDRAIVVLQVADGTLERKYTIQPKTEFFAGLRADGVAYLMRSSGLHAVRLRDDNVLWHSATLVDAATQEPYGLHSMANVEATGEYVFYAYRHRLADAHMLVVGALEAATGRALWQWRGPELPLPMIGGASLTAALGQLYLISHEGMFAFNGNDGHLLWQHHPGYNERRWAPVVIRTESAAG
jgi:outer membrane protein assembly factor BamB